MDISAKVFSCYLDRKLAVSKRQGVTGHFALAKVYCPHSVSLLMLHISASVEYQSFILPTVLLNLLSNR